LLKLVAVDVTSSYVSASPSLSETEHAKHRGCSLALEEATDFFSFADAGMRRRCRADPDDK